MHNDDYDEPLHNLFVLYILGARARNFRKESPVKLLYRGKSMECLARAIEHDETDAVPRLAEYVRHFHADRVGITPETTEEKFNELVTAAAKTYPVVTIRLHSSVSGS